MQLSINKMLYKNINIVSSIFRRRQSRLVSALFTLPDRFKDKKIVFSKKVAPLGIDIGTNSLKIAQLLPTRDGFTLSDLITEEFSWELINDPVKKREALPEIIKRFIQEHKLPSKVYASLSANLAQIKTIHLSPMPKEEIDSALYWELEQTTTMRMQDISFDYIILDEDNLLNKSSIEVLVFIVAKKDILEYIDILTLAGLKPLAIDIDPLSAISALNFMGQINSNEVVILLELGAGASSLSVIENKELRLVKNLSINGNLLTSLIKHKLNTCLPTGKTCLPTGKISFQEAEDIKRGIDCLSPKEEEGISDIIKSNLENLILDIERTFKYYSYQLTRSRIGWFNRIILSGGCSLLTNIDRYLSNRLEVPVQIVDPFRRINISQRVNSIFPNINNMSARLSVCMGLALRGQIEE